MLGTDRNVEIIEGTSLLSNAYKVLTDIIQQSITSYVEENLGDYQGGFRKQTPSTRQSFTVRQKSLKYLLTSSKHTIKTRGSYPTKKRRNTPNVTRMSTITRGEKFISRICGRKIGGDRLAPILFNIAFDKVTDARGIILYRDQQIVAHEDYVTFVRTIRGLEFKELKEKTQPMRLKADVDKTKAIESRSRPRREQSWNVRNNRTELHRIVR